jgi:asparagine synthase (glutamine-hydrolysing)
MPKRKGALDSPPKEHRSGSAGDRPGSWLAHLGDAERVQPPTTETGERFVHRFDGEWSRCLLVAAEPGQALPQIAEQGPIVVVFEGRLHNRAELARLDRQDAPGPGADARLVLNAYAALGAEALRRIRGFFALVICDAERQCVLCASDPLGVYPLYHARVGHDLLVSPAIELLLAQDGVSRDPNRLSLAGFIVDLAPRQDETFFAGVKRVPPGHSVDLAAGSPPSRYWDFESQHIAADTRDPVGQFEELLRQAVRRCLDFGPAGIWLSGGVDSAAVATAAAREAREGAACAPWALSLVFPDPACNEEHLQRLLAERLELPQLIGPLEDFAPAEGLLRSSLDLSRRSLAPPQSFWQVPYDRLALAGKERGCRVVLSGDGGDEWLQPPLVYAADRLLALDLSSLSRLRRAWERYYPISRRQSFRSALWFYGARPLLRATAASALRRVRPSALDAYRRKRLVSSLPRWLAPDPVLRASLVERGLEEAATPGPEAVYRRAHHARRSQPWLLYSVETSFERSRRLGVRILNPLLDPDLLALLDGAAPEVLNRGGRAKGLARELTLEAVPALGDQWPRKVHAEAFWLSTVRKEGPGAWSSLGGVSGLGELGVVDAARFESERERAFARPLATAEPVWEVLSLEAWLAAGRSGILPPCK